MNPSKKPLVLSALLAALSAGGLLASSRLVSGADDAAKPVAAIKDVMLAVNAGEGGIVAQLKADFGNDKLDDDGWATAKARATMIMEAGNLLYSMKPPKGDEATWKKHVTEYRACAEQAREAATKKDAAAGKAAMTGLQKRCAECHKDHQKDE